MRATQAFLPPKLRNYATPRATATRLLTEGGFIHAQGKGLYAWLPLGMRVVQNLRRAVELEIRKLGGEEILLPILNPLGFREASGRDRMVADEVLMMNDRHGEMLVFAPEHEEGMVALLKEMVHDSNQLPAFFYQMQAKGRDSPDSSGGIFNARERLGIDSYSVHSSYTGLNNFIPKLFQACQAIFRQCSLTPWVAEGMPAYPGGEGSMDFIIASKQGDYRVVSCEKCGYAADQQVAVGLAKVAFSRLLPLTIALHAELGSLFDLAKHAGIPNSRIAVCQLWSSLNGVVMSITRGDQHVSPIKVSRLLGEAVIGLVNPEDYLELGLTPDFLSPIALDEERLATLGIQVLVDTIVADTPNLIMGANFKGGYFANANFGRDFEGKRVGDLSLVDERNRCYHCGGTLKVQNALKLATISRLDDFFSKGMAFTVNSPEGKALYPQMASFSVGMDRLIGAIAQASRDRRGISWPIQLAPFKVVLLVVGKSRTLQNMGRSIHDQLPGMILWDDRAIAFTEKIKDADRMGVPLRIIVSASSLVNNQVVLMKRDGTKIERVGLNQLLSNLQEILALEDEQTGCDNEI